MTNTYVPDDRTGFTAQSLWDPEHPAAAKTFADLVDAVAGKSWQFTPEAYGAKGDGKSLADVAVTSGSAVVTSASANFTSGDVGKHIMINGAIGAANIALMTTISSVQSTTQVTLAATASVTATALNAVYGTDDTSAIQAASDAACAYAVAHEYYGEVLLRDAYYIVAGAPQQTSGSPAYYNTQIRIPYAPSNTNRKLVIAYIGAGDASNLQYWGSTVPGMSGTCLVSMVNAPSTIDATYGPQSVLGAPTGYSGFSGNFVNTKAIVQNLSIWCTPYTNNTALDLSWIGGCRIDGFGAHIFAQPLSGNGAILNTMIGDAVFANRAGVGVRMPVIGNNADVWCPTLAVEGYKTGLYAAEHVRIGNLKTIYTNVGIILDGSLGLSSEAHGLEILGWTAEAYQGGILVASGGIFPVNIVMSTENSASGGYDVSDSSNSLRGVIRWADSVDNRSPVVVGAGNVRVIDDTQARGAKTAPAVPATTVALRNPFWQDCAVTVVGGTISAIAVDGQTIGLTSGTVIVPSGKSITLTYTVAPTWHWIAL